MSRLAYALSVLGTAALGWVGRDFYVENHWSHAHHAPRCYTYHHVDGAIHGPNVSVCDEQLRQAMTTGPVSRPSTSMKPTQ